MPRSREQVYSLNDDQPKCILLHGYLLLFATLLHSTELMLKSRYGQKKLNEEGQKYVIKITKSRAAVRCQRSL
jgi:hypothetical protein